jgi:hypothetical protein
MTSIRTVELGMITELFSSWTMFMVIRRKEANLKKLGARNAAVLPESTEDSTQVKRQVSF